MDEINREALARFFKEHDIHRRNFSPRRNVSVGMYGGISSTASEVRNIFDEKDPFAIVWFKFAYIDGEDPFATDYTIIFTPKIASFIDVSRELLELILTGCIEDEDVIYSKVNSPDDENPSGVDGLWSIRLVFNTPVWADTVRHLLGKIHAVLSLEMDFDDITQPDRMIISVSYGEPYVYGYGEEALTIPTVAAFVIVDPGLSRSYTVHLSEKVATVLGHEGLDKAAQALKANWPQIKKYEISPPMSSSNVYAIHRHLRLTVYTSAECGVSTVEAMIRDLLSSSL